jgi:hypothetical protein
MPEYTEHGRKFAVAEGEEGRRRAMSKLIAKLLKLGGLLAPAQREVR